MSDMRRAAVSSSGAILLAMASLATVTACVPRPARLERPTATAGPTRDAAPTPGETTPLVLAGPTPTPSFTRPTPLPAPTFLAYNVKRGDTLTSIAREFRTTPRSIAFWSRGEHPSLDPESAAYQPDRLEIGWVLLLIPDSVFDEDELMDATPSPATQAPVDATSSPSQSPSPTAR